MDRPSKSVLAAWLVVLLAVSCSSSTCMAQAPPGANAAGPDDATSPERPESFWDDASVQFAEPGDLTPFFAGFNSTWGKRVLMLSEGEYLLPGQNAQVGILGHVRLVGVGINVTYVHFRGYQKVFMVPSGSTFEHHNLTVTGITTGTYLYRTTAPIAGSKPSYATVFYINVEKWVAVDDLGAGVSPAPSSLCPANTTGPCTVGYIAAIMRKIILLAPDDTDLYGNDSDVIYSDNYIQYLPSKGYFWLRFKDLISLGYNTIVYYDVVLRNDPPPPRPDMRALFNWFVTNYPGAAGSTECYNPEANDLGFSYRGNKSQSANGLPCIPWDDPRIQLNAFQPNKAGFSSVESNYCRNPRFFEFEVQGPWCNVIMDGEATYQPCGVPACSVTTVGPAKGSDDGSTAAKIGGSIGAVVGAAAILGALWLWWRHRSRRAEYAPSAPVDKIWHVEEPFETMKSAPPERYREAIEKSPSKPPRDVLDIVYEMLQPGVSVPSLLREDLAYKYGPRWAAEHHIDVSTVLGAGAIGQVYAGTRGGTPVAYKVMNQMKTYPRTVRFMQKSILPVLRIQDTPDFPLDNPHLLPLIDCVMFPQWFTLVEMGKEHGPYGAEWRSEVSTGPRRSLASQAAQGSSCSTDVPKRSVSTGASTSERIASALWTQAPPPVPAPATSPPAADAGHPAVKDAGHPAVKAAPLEEVLTVSQDAPSLEAVSQAEAETSQGTIVPALALNAPGSYGDAAPYPMFSFTSDVSSLGGNGDNGQGCSVSQSESFARALATTAPAPIPVTSPRFGSSHLSDDDDDSSTGQARAPLNATTLQAMAVQAPRSSPSATASAPSKANKSPAGNRATVLEHVPDIVSQVIMVFPLCELGTLAALIHGRTNVRCTHIASIPMRALPPQMQAWVRDRPKLGVCMTIDEHDTSVAEPSAGAEQHSVTVGQLQPLWQSILKLQLALQVIDGVMALHAARLIHCDIKPENIFLTASSAFEPYGICVKIGDMDTCRSLPNSQKGALSDAGGGTSRRVGHSDSRRLEPSLSAGKSIFTSALKGTPGFIAPEMLALGKVAATTDVFSVAITVSMLISASYCFHKHDDMHMRCECEYPVWITQDVRQMLLRCHHADPASRPGLSRLRSVLQTQFRALLARATQEASL